MFPLITFRSQLEYDPAFMCDVSLQIESEFNGEIKSIVPEHKKHRHKWVARFHCFYATAGSSANKIDTFFLLLYLLLPHDSARHQHHDHERCKERRRRKRRKILVHNLDDKSLKVWRMLFQWGFYLLNNLRIGNRSRRASTTSEVYNHRYCMSSADNVLAAGGNNVEIESTDWRYG